MDRILAGAAQVSLDIRIAWRGTCRKRHVYNPIRQRLAGIRGGCVDCLALFEISKVWLALQQLPEFQRLEQLMKTYDEKADPEGRCRG